MILLLPVSTSFSFMPTHPVSPKLSLHTTITPCSRVQPLSALPFSTVNVNASDRFQSATATSNSSCHLSFKLFTIVNVNPPPFRSIYFSFHNVTSVSPCHGSSWKKLPHSNPSKLSSTSLI